MNVCVTLHIKIHSLPLTCTFHLSACPNPPGSQTKSFSWSTQGVPAPVLGPPEMYANPAPFWSSRCPQKYGRQHTRLPGHKSSSAHETH